MTSHLYEVKYEGKVPVTKNVISAKFVDDIINGWVRVFFIKYTLHYRKMRIILNNEMYIKFVLYSY